MTQKQSRPAGTGRLTTTTTTASIRSRHGRRTANPARELVAWALAVEHLHARGLPAAVPPFPAAWLRRRGIRADWVAAS